MKAAFITQPGPPEVIQFEELPEPVCGPSECLIDVESVALNPIDTYIRSGAIALQRPSPYILGCDFAGTVVSTGDAVTLCKAGDRVWGSNQGLLGRQGTFAQRIAVDEAWIYPCAPDVTADQAAAAALVGITAHLGLFRNARITPDDTVLVQGGAGGVGSMVVQMAKCAGARVIATAGSPDKAVFCRKLGADEVISRWKEPVSSALSQLAPQGVDLWWETRREPDFDEVVAALAPRGRMVLMAGRDARPPFPVGPFYVKGCSLHGFAMFNATPDEQRGCAEDIRSWMSEGRLQAHIDRTLPLSAAAEAHRLQEENTIHNRGTLSGKIVLRP